MFLFYRYQIIIVKQFKLIGLLQEFGLKFIQYRIVILHYFLFLVRHLLGLNSFALTLFLE